MLRGARAVEIGRADYYRKADYLLQKLLDAVRRFNDVEPKHRRLRVTQEGVCLFSAKSARELWSFRWDDLEEIVAFKVDALTLDHVCLGFRTSAAETFHVADEDTSAWNELNDALARRFGIDQSKWFQKVAVPAFAENWTSLWKRVA